jgi:deoxyribodipyrimidine photo-lyase
LHFPPSSTPMSIAIPTTPTPKPGGSESDIALGFRSAAMNNVAQQLGADVVRIPSFSAAAVLEWCQAENIQTVAVAYAPVGPEADLLSSIEQHLAKHDISLLRVRRRYDTLTWPHATKGFFGLKDKLPMLLQKLDLQGQQGQLI